MTTHRLYLFFPLALSSIAAFFPTGGCAAARDQALVDEGSGASSPSSASGGGAAAAPGLGGHAAGTGGDSSGGLDPTGGGPPPEDADGDGFTTADGDCNDHDKNVNPGALEVVVTEPDATGAVPAPADEDCDGEIDNVPPPCDEGLAVGEFDALHGAKAVDLCAAASPDDRRWGVLRARYVRGSGAPAEPSAAVGLLDAFGPNVRVQGGARMLALSTGRARLPRTQGACNSDSCASYGPGTAPDGFPQDNPSCPPSAKISDDIGLEVTLRAPTNATGYEFLFKFYTFEYPEWVCDEFNDQFLALATPPPPGSYNGNLSFDSRGNPVSVNIAFFDVCSGCPKGDGELAGNGFGEWSDAGATSWLKTQAPVTGGETITLRFMIFDTGDEQLDSTALVDGFRWIASGGTVAVGTAPVDTPR